MSSRNDCLYRWWVIKKWLTDHNIIHEEHGVSCPKSNQKVCDFIMYITQDKQENYPDPLQVQELKDWLFNTAVNKRIDTVAEKIGLSKQDIINDINHGSREIFSNYADLLKDK